MERIFCVYILTNKPGGLFYVGITSNIILRIEQHKNDVVEGFTKRYQLHQLVYYEIHGMAYEAISREKKLKNGNDLGKSGSSKPKTWNGGTCRKISKFFSKRGSLPSQALPECLRRRSSSR